jgi:hypothetical protein
MGSKKNNSSATPLSRQAGPDGDQRAHPPPLPAKNIAQGLGDRLDVVVAEAGRRVVGFRRHRSFCHESAKYPC